MLTAREREGKLTQQLTGRYEREVTLSMLYHMTRHAGHTWPLRQDNIASYLAAAFETEKQYFDRLHGLRRRYRERYNRWHQKAQATWLWKMIPTLGLAALFGVKRPKSLDGNRRYYEYTVSPARQRMDRFVDKLVPHPDIGFILPHVRGLRDIWEGIVELHEREGVRIENRSDDPNFLLHPQEAITTLFDRWAASEEETVH